MHSKRHIFSLALLLLPVTYTETMQYLTKFNKGLLFTFGSLSALRGAAHMYDNAVGSLKDTLSSKEQFSARPLDTCRAEMLNSMLKEVGATEEIGLWEADTPHSNATASKNIEGYNIWFDSSHITQYQKEDVLRYWLLHEYGHIKNRDFDLKKESFYPALFYLSGAAALALAKKPLSSLVNRHPLISTLIIPYVCGLWGAYVIPKIIKGTVRKKEEFNADDFAFTTLVKQQKTHEIVSVITNFIELYEKSPDHQGKLIKKAHLIDSHPAPFERAEHGLNHLKRYLDQKNISFDDFLEQLPENTNPKVKKCFARQIKEHFPQLLKQPALPIR